jgi:arylsulfatase A-like enzyme
MAALALALGACAHDERPDVLFVTIDTLRRDHVSAYGFAYARTPAFDGVAAEGALFESHYAVTGLTGPAHTTLFTGLHPRQHGVRRNGQAVPGTLRLVAEVFRDAGYRTGASVGAAVVGSEFGLDRGFEAFDESFDVGELERASREHTGAYERLAEDVVDAALAWLDAMPTDEPVFLWVHLFDPHLPHLRPHTEWPREAELVRDGCIFAEPNEFQGAPHVARLRRGYTAEVRYADGELGRLLARFDAWGSGREAAVVLTADHGEGLGEHSYIGHSFYLYEEQLRIPLAIRSSSRIPAGSRVRSTTSSVDVAATVLDLAGLAMPRELGGSSLLRLLEDDTSRAPVFAERPPLADATRRLRRGEERPDDPKSLQGRLVRARAGRAGSGELSLVAVVRDGWKHVWSEDAPDELYDLRADPRELMDLDGESDGAAALRRLSESWRASTRPLHSLSGDVADDATRDMLDALGY